MAYTELVTPAWVCNWQNNLIDEAWFERKNVFNSAQGKTWQAQPTPITFPGQKSWQTYVKSPRLEIACGEAPYLTSRIDGETNQPISYTERIGILDRKLRIVSENTKSNTEWQRWALIALKSTYGYDINMTLIKRARANLLHTFKDAYHEQGFPEDIDALLKQAEAIMHQNIQVWDGNNHEKRPEFLNTEFEAIVGNPPYHSKRGAGGNNDAPIYQNFMQLALSLQPKYISLVIPARWFAAGRENLLGGFRHLMTDAGNLRNLEVYADSEQVFPQVKIRGGVCSFLYDKTYQGKCNYVLWENHEEIHIERDLVETDILIRDPRIAKIVQKVTQIIKQQNLPTVDGIISFNTPFGITSDLKIIGQGEIQLFAEKTAKHSTALYFYDKPHRVKRYINGRKIIKNRNLIQREKVLLPVASGTGEDNKVLGKLQYIGKNSVCSQTYLCASFKTATTAKNFLRYAQTKFFRLLVKARKVSQSAPRRVYQFVPLEDLQKTSEIDWSKPIKQIDQQLYQKYHLSPTEIDFIERTIAPLTIYD